MTPRARQGLTAIEFALVAPLVMVLTFASMDYAWFFVGYQEVQHLTREASRVGAQAAVDQSPVDAALDHVEASSTHGLALASFDLLATADVVDDDSALVVRVTADYSPLIGLLPMPPTISAGARLPLEVQ